MKRRPILLIVPALLIFLLGLPPASARAEQTASPEAEKLLVKLIEAVKAESYEAFLADADAAVKKHLSRQQFEGLCGLYTKPLKKGYALEYLGQLKQHGFTVYLWKLTGVDATEDILVKLAVKDGKVGGVWVS
jgi:hypothetical protein